MADKPAYNPAEVALGRAPRCPKCRSRRTAHIIIGYPLGGPPVPPNCVFGYGCCPPPDPKAYSCRACGHDWGIHPHMKERSKSDG
jgi:hypothetical protein